MSIKSLVRVVIRHEYWFVYQTGSIIIFTMYANKVVVFFSFAICLIEAELPREKFRVFARQEAEDLRHGKGWVYPRNVSNSRDRNKMGQVLVRIFIQSQQKPMVHRMKPLKNHLQNMVYQKLLLNHVKTLIWMMTHQPIIPNLT